MSKRRLVILGAGGHGKVCAEIAAASGQYNSIVFSDQRVDRGTRILHWSVKYHDADLPRVDSSGAEYFIGLGQTALGMARERLYLWLLRHELQIATLIGAYACVSPSASVGAGTVVGNSALVQTSAVIGDNCIINSKSLAEHDAVIGSHVHLSPGATINGGSSVGDRCLIGSGAVVNHGVDICADTIVGSGAVVTRNIIEPGVYTGVPAVQVARGHR